ncbi:MAG: peptide/nickel transport system substrate-binding protein [Candidatus Eremiobacteraeota bacterium]|jgi:peptide/nickel transport system substrate-binding protein|nr:peptide/nickel transport system substrate-binding protein [Candidatus Eremiobacteraeota bacterium]
MPPFSGTAFFAAAVVGAVAQLFGPPGASAAPAETPLRGGSATFAEAPGFPPVVIFPFSPGRLFGLRNVTEFQPLMFRPLYFFGGRGKPEVDYDLSIGKPPEWSADGRTVTVTVKPWAWSNGERVDADGVMLWMHVFEANKGEHGAYVPGYFPDNLSSYRKVAPDKVSFTFDKVYSHAWVLASQLSMIVPFPHAWDRTAAGPADATHGTADAKAVYAYLWSRNDDRASWDTSPLWSVVDGPWRLTHYTVDGHATFVPNSAYSGPNKPYLAEFKLRPSLSDDEEFATLQAGPAARDGIQVGYLPFNHVIEPTSGPLVGGPTPLQGRYDVAPQIVYGIHYFPINFNNPTVGPLFRQLYFRQAFQSVVDQDSAIRDVYKGYGYRADGPVPALPASDAISPRVRRPLYPFDVAKAKRLLSEHGWDTSTTPATCTTPAKCGAGIPQGMKLTVALDYAEGRPTLTQVMTKLKADAARAGIEVVLKARVGSAIVADAVPCTPSVPKPPCDWQMASWNGGWVYGPSYSPTGEAQYGSGAGVNFGSYSDPVADALIDKTVHGDDLRDFYAYQDYIAEQLPFVFMPNFPPRLLAVAKNLRVGPLNPYAILMPENWYFVAP